MPARLEIDGGVQLQGMARVRAAKRLETKLHTLGARIERRR